jgi:hypothetical protein
MVAPWRRILGDVRFVCGVDPAFAGLHRFTETTDDRSYKSVAHCCYPHHLSDRPKVERVPTVVLPEPVSSLMVVHELGHVLHGRLQFCDGPTSFVTEYAKSNRFEQFAEYFTAQLFHYGDEDAWGSDPFRHRLTALRFGEWRD